MRALYTVVVVAVIAGCASIHPAAVQVGDRCFNCRRTIGNLQLAAEVVDQLMTPRPFRTAGCLARYLKARPNEPVAAVFVTDYRTGRMLPADDAWFVPTTVTLADGKPGEPDYLAFRSRTDAAGESGGKPVLLRWAQVIAEASAQ
jgi:hypothetical protein